MANRDLDESHRRTEFEVAIIGMAGRFPGAMNIEQFWDNLKKGRDCMSFFSDEELTEQGISAELFNNSNYIKAKGILADVEYFDAAFFGYTAAEAEIMDPQLRIFHECSWEALEDAGYDPKNCDGLIGLYGGAGFNPYWIVRYLSRMNTLSEQFEVIGLNARDFLATRVAYKLNLKGPAVTVLTACSTSLFAIHLACQGILSGECDMALAGGITILFPSLSLPRKYGNIYQEGMVLSPDGHCRAFDALAMGTNGGDGVGIVVLKSLEGAINDGDYIYAVIKGSAANNDGSEKAGYTAPAAEAQAAVIRAALLVAGVEIDSIGFIEAHGTGTILGDPIEIEGLKLAFNTDKKNFCALGSVKTNVGHLDAAAGAAGFIKTVLALHHRFLPPSLHFETPNPGIDFANSPFYVNTTSKEWENDVYPLRAGVSSFGIGGTNVHVVLEEWPPAQAAGQGGVPSRTDRLILLSARTPTAMDKIAARLADYFKKNPDINLAHAAYTLQSGRKAFQYRRMLVCSNTREAIEKLSPQEPGKFKTFKVKEEKPGVIFMFPGLGAQYVGMGSELYQKEPLFRQEMDGCFDILKSFLGYDLREILYPRDSASGMSEEVSPRSPDSNTSHTAHMSHVPGNKNINQIEIAQAVIFILEYALAKLLMAWGIHPDAMIGYSFGEYAAACLAGVFSLEEALKLVTARGILIQELPTGAMLSVPLGAEELKPLLKDDISLAIDNGPSCIVAGPISSVKLLERNLKKKKCLCMPLNTSHAVHSGMMDPGLEKFEKKVKEIELHPPRIPYLSNLTGRWITGEQAMDPRYWVHHLRETVRFADGVRELLKKTAAVFIEIGPGWDLSALLGRFIDDKPDHKVLNLVRPAGQEPGDVYYLLNKLGYLWLYGVEIDWKAFNSAENKQRIPLPTYPFEGQRFWPEGETLDINLGVSSPSSLMKLRPGIADWFYVPIWEQSPLLPVASLASGETHKWLIFVDRCGVGEALACCLEQCGQEVITVQWSDEHDGKDFYKSSTTGRTGRFTLAPRSDNGYNILFKELRDLNWLPRKILHFWGVSVSNPGKPGFEMFEASQDLGLYSLLGIVQAIGNQRITGEIEILVISNDLVEVTGEEYVRPEKATVLGPVKVIPLEYTNIKCRCIDIVIPGPGKPDQERLMSQLLAECMPGYPGEISAWRGKYRWVQTFKSCRLEALDPGKRDLLLKKKGVYLILGGFGGMGFTLAEFLAEKYKARLILVGRSDFPAREEWDEWLTAHDPDDPDNQVSFRIRKIQSFENSGAEVMVFSADAADQEQMKKVIRQGREGFGQINGVIHAAGVVDYSGVIQRRTREMTQKAIASKVNGTIVLDHLLKDESLDFLVFFSSLGNYLYGTKFGQVGYNAANEFLDAFSYYKNSRGGPFTITINWNDWKEVGMSVQAIKQKYPGSIRAEAFEFFLHDAVTPAEGAEVFERILCHRLPRAAVCKMDLPGAIKQPRTFKDKDSFLPGLEDETVIPGKGHQRPELSAPYEAPRDPLEKTLVEIWQYLFGIQKVGINDNFFELGGDSLKAITATARIRKELNLEVLLTDFFTNPTVELLAKTLNPQRDDNKVWESKVKSPFKTPEPEHIHQPFPLTDIQSAYLVGRSDQFDIGRISTHIYLEMNTQWDIHLLNQGLKKLIGRHPMLRAVITPGGQQRILEEIPEYEIKVKDLCHLNRERQMEEILKERERMSHYIFDIQQWPLFEIKGFKLSFENLYLFFGFDLLIGDAASLEIIARELVAFCENPAVQPPPLEFSFRDYVLACQEIKASDVYTRDKQYWLSRLEDFPFAPRLPLKCSPGDISEPHFKRHQHIFSKEEWTKLEAFARENNTTPSVLLCTGFVKVLAYWSNQPNLALNLTIFNRYPFHPEVNKIVGDFTSLILLGLSLEPGDSFWDIGAKVRRALLGALEHRRYDGVEFIRDISRHHNLGTQAVMPVVFTSTLFEGSDQDSLFWNQLGEITMGISQTSQVYLDNQVRLQGQRLIMVWDYVEELFESRIIDLMFDQYIMIITKLMDGNTDYQIQPPAEDLSLLREYNRTGEDIKPTTLHQLFKEQVRRTPGNTAVESGNIKLTYKELDEKSNQVAAYLRELGVGTNEGVAVLTDRGLETIVNVMGILKAGAAYVPIDADYPPERRNYISGNSQCRLWLEPDSYKRENLGRFPVKEVENLNCPGDLAYVIYTSGSTGRPKGVVITHGQATNTVMDINRKFNVNEKDRILGISSMGFDLSVYDVFGTLSTGAALVLIPNPKDVDVLLEALDTKGITSWNSVPAILDMVVKNLEEDDVNECLTRALLSGDWIPLALPASVKKHFPNCDVISLGGATEGSIWSIYYPIREINPHWKSIPYGSPLANQTFYVLNYRQQLCPVGVPGELYIGGAGVAQGYMNNEKQTKKAFVHHPQLGRLYRTGDYGVFHPGGYIEFLGRKDYQVKIRGYRVELGEIENCLMEHDAVKNTVVLDRIKSTGQKYLCAYIVPKPGASENLLSSVELRNFLGRKLPGYMIPSFFINLEQIPLTANGKVDRKALPQIEEEPREVEYILPTNPSEEKLLEIWSQELEIEKDKIGIGSDFFGLGGHSLIAAGVIRKIHKEMNVKVPLKELFKDPTIKGIARYIADAVGEKYTALESAEEKEYYPVSSAQKRMLILNRFKGEDTVSDTIIDVLALEGKLEKRKLENALQQLVQRHEILRTSFEILHMEPVQRIHKTVDFEIGMVCMEAGEEELPGIIKNFITPFALGQLPLLRVGLVKVSQNKHIFIFHIHHIITDGTSMTIMMNELIGIYNGETQPRLRVQYKDFTVWQNKFLQSEAVKKQEQYWLGVFPADQDDLPVLHLPTDFPRPRLQSFEGNYLRFEIGKDLAAAIKKLRRESGATLYMVLLAVYNIFLSRYSGQEDIIVGTPIMGRPHFNLANVTGMFVNTLAMRNFPRGEETFGEFLGEVNTNALQAYENQDYQFEELVNRLAIKPDPGRQTLFDTMLDTANYRGPDKIVKDLIIKPFIFENPIIQFDLLIHAYEDGEDICLQWLYCTKLFKKETLEKMARHLVNIAGEVTANPGLKISQINMLTDKEREELVSRFCKEKLSDMEMDIVFSPGIKGKTIHQLFGEQVEGSGNHTAVIFGPEKLTYNELNKKSDQLARELRTRGVGPDTVVALMMDRSIEMLAAILGILKAGAAYLPLDPQYPVERVTYMLEDSKAKILVSMVSKVNIGSRSCEVIDINNHNRDKDKDVESTPPLLLTPSPTQLCYIVYTSGSTGRPKGVMLEHSTLVNLMLYQFECTSIDFRRVLQFAAAGFDVSLQEIFSVLLSGGGLYLIPGEMRTDIPWLFRFIEKNDIKTLFLPPSILKVVFSEKVYADIFPGSVHHIVAAGDRLVVSHGFRNCLQKNNIYLHNHYGPSEAHVVTAFTLDPTKDIPTLPSIGRPVSNTIIYILDKYGNWLPVGVPGELCIGGIQVGRGYLNNPELTAEKFCLRRPGGFFRENRPLDARKSFLLQSCNHASMPLAPQHSHPSTTHHSPLTIYHTGDLARWLPDSNIEFLGRIDHQIKIRGFRIEIGEIENQLLKHEKIKDAVITIIEQPGAKKYLCAYIVSGDPGPVRDREPGINEIKAYLSRRLPGYMIPEYVVFMDKIPLNSNGKVNREALPKPALRSGIQYAAPQRDIEVKIANIWKEVLNLDIIGVDDSFFEVGGNSINIIKVSARLREVFQRDIPVVKIFEYSTISTFSDYMEQLENSTVQSLNQSQLENFDLIQEQSLNMLEQTMKIITDEESCT